jgi:hypothetical protein
MQPCSELGCPNTTNRVCFTCQKPFCDEHLHETTMSTWDGQRYTDMKVWLCSEHYAQAKGQ